MTPTPPSGNSAVQSSPFQSSMIAAGTDPDVAAELERRIEIIERDEAHDDSRLPLSVREIITYLAVTVAAVGIGFLVVIL
jgi:hypothetical protein